MGITFGRSVSQMCDYRISNWVRGEKNIESITDHLDALGCIYHVKHKRNGYWAVFRPKRDVFPHVWKPIAYKKKRCRPRKPRPDAGITAAPSPKSGAVVDRR